MTSPREAQGKGSQKRSSHLHPDYFGQLYLNIQKMYLTLQIKYHQSDLMSNHLILGFKNNNLKMVLCYSRNSTVYFKSWNHSPGKELKVDIFQFLIQSWNHLRCSAFSVSNSLLASSSSSEKSKSNSPPASGEVWPPLKLTSEDVVAPNTSN